MKLDEGRMTDFLMLPIEEAEAIIEAMKQAEQVGDIETLSWATRRIVWLYEEASNVTGYDDRDYPAHLFNKVWAETLKNDPPPESIAATIAKIGQGEPETV